MSFQREIEAKLLWKLYIRLHEGSSALTKKQFKAAIGKDMNVSSYRFEDAFQNLQKWRYLKSESADDVVEATYRLSARGVDWVEDWYHVSKEGDMYYFEPRHKGAVMVDQLRNEFLLKQPTKATKHHDTVFWTKWGAVAAIIALPLAVLLWWNA